MKILELKNVENEILINKSVAMDLGEDIIGKRVTV